jgi:hypothetical protein
VAVVSLHLDEWSGASCADHRVEAPSWDQVDEAIRSLDASRHTLLSLEGQADDVLLIGGGAGRYVVIYQVRADTFWNLHSDAADGGTILLTCGGQEGDFLSEQVVGIEVAKSAARTMFSVGGIAGSLNWKQQA